jgi:protein required for attachment to host cells
MAMNGFLLHHGAAVLVCDGRKALFLVNDGHPGREVLRVAREVEHELAAHSADLGTDRPGLSRQMAAGIPGSAMESVDLHDLEEERFLKQITTTFTAFVEERQADQVVLVAPPRALASLRKHAPATLLKRTVVQVDKDLTKHPVAEITRILLA